jgi:hypothetical protein
VGDRLLAKKVAEKRRFSVGSALLSGLMVACPSELAELRGLEFPLQPILLRASNRLKAEHQIF